MEPAEKRMFLWILNSGIRPSEAARRIAVNCDDVSPTTVGTEEEGKPAPWEG